MLYTLNLSFLFPLIFRFYFEVRMVYIEYLAEYQRKIIKWFMYERWCKKYLSVYEWVRKIINLYLIVCQLLLAQRHIIFDCSIACEKIIKYFIRRNLWNISEEKCSKTAIGIILFVIVKGVILKINLVELAGICLVDDL